MFALSMALRFLKEGRSQTLLILGGAAVGVAVIVFLSALMTSLQDSLIDRTLGAQAHVVVRPRDEEPVRLLRGEGVVSLVQQPAQRLQSIEQWPRVLEEVARAPHVIAVSPLVSGSAVAIRGVAQRSITLRGIEPERFDRIVSLQRRMVRGDWRITGDGALIGKELARELGLDVGDRLRVLVDEEHATTYRVQGIFDVGSKDVNARWVLAPLKSAQTLFALEGGVTLLECRVDDIFAANETAAAIRSRTGLVAESWMTLNAELMNGLRGQSASSSMIQVFVVVAVALGISSVLVVSVVQKGREIGILRAMGATMRQVNRIFLWQGVIVGVFGSALGTALGAAFVLLFGTLASTPEGKPLFDIDIEIGLVVRTAIIALTTGVLSALLPARRAARLDPVEAIRNG